MTNHGADFWNFTSLCRHKLLADHQATYLIHTFVAVLGPAVPDVLLDDAVTEAIPAGFASAPLSSHCKISYWIA